MGLRLIRTFNHGRSQSRYLDDSRSHLCKSPNGHPRPPEVGPNRHVSDGHSIMPHFLSRRFVQRQRVTRWETIVVPANLLVQWWSRRPATPPGPLGNKTSCQGFAFILNFSSHFTRATWLSHAQIRCSCLIRPAEIDNHSQYIKDGKHAVCFGSHNNHAARGPAWLPALHSLFVKP